MKRNYNKLYKTIFLFFLLCFSMIYFAEVAGYYEYQNYKKAALTEEQIRKFESDVNEGKELDITEYLVSNESSYTNRLSKITYELSNSISSIVQSGVSKTFKFLSNLIEE